MTAFPRDTRLDSTLALLSEGYTFISSRCRRYGSDVFETRLMLRQAVCVLGEDAARMFYVPDRFTRRGALPPTTLWLLQDEGSASVLDGEAHRWRKQLFMSLMTPAHLQRLVDQVVEQWRLQMAAWERSERVVLHQAVQEVLCRAVCRWAGVPLSEEEAAQRTREFAAMIDGAGAVGPRNWRGLLLRRRTERWVRGIVERVRAGQLDVPLESAAHAIAWHRRPGGALLAPGVATVELINVLRPTVAVGLYVTFAALALHEHAAARRQLLDALQDPNPEVGERALERFAHEVRRFYPFFPFAGGRARRAFEWRGHHFARGTWVLLDLYGTNHDPRIWDAPETFSPDRFRRWDGNAFTLVPQGGGDYLANHRCAGEPATVAIFKAALRLLCTEMRYDVPAQDLRIDLSRLPAVPRSRFVIANVRPAPPAARVAAQDATAT